eukprot:m51a1_g6350 putative transcriptional sir2 family (285) ;mRNA; f:80465-81939
MADETEASLQALASAITSGASVLFITGAGTSVASGVPAYRTGENSVWGHWMYEWGTRRKFTEDPSRWWNEFWLKTHETNKFMGAEPCAAHTALSRIMRCNRNVRLATQNIDRLHWKAGVDDARYIELHGALGMYRCTNAKCEYACEKALRNVQMLRTEDGKLVPPVCPGCGALVLPMSLMFDEAYRSHKYFRHEQLVDWLDVADALVFVGTSFSVGVTSAALRAAAASGASIFVFDIECRDTAVSETVSCHVSHVLGPCEDTLPRLASMCGADTWRYSDYCYMQ